MDTAEKLFAFFVKDFKKYYNRNLAYSTHSLLHVVDCVRSLGPADSFSAYKYENVIMKLQKYVRSNTNIFSQINNRLTEKEKANVDVTNNKEKFFKVDASNKNKCYRLRDNNYGVVVKLLDCKEKCLFRVYKKSDCFFETPLKSTALGIVQVQESDLGEEMLVNVSDLQRKCYRMPYTDDKFVLVPLIT